jgi:hypothetical protein
MKNARLILFLLLATALALWGGRIEYLRRYEAFHEREAHRYAEMIGAQRNITQVEVDAALETAAENPQDDRLDYTYRQVFYHQSAAHLYQEAAYRPWMIVHEAPPPQRRYDD